jgi:hypothetical protein
MTKYETLRRIKRASGSGKSRDVKVVSKSKEVVVGLGCRSTVVKGCCVGCGVVLTFANRSLDSHMCKNCFMVDMAEIEAEDRREDSLSEAERLAAFLGCSLAEAEQRLANDNC